jgi:hypothetical protein
VPMEQGACSMRLVGRDEYAFMMRKPNTLHGREEDALAREGPKSCTGRHIRHCFTANSLRLPVIKYNVGCQKQLIVFQWSEHGCRPPATKR